MAAWEEELLSGPDQRLLDRVTGHADLADYAAETYLELYTLLVSKHRDYGPHAITRAPGGALAGVLVRAHDKLQRAIHLTRADNTAAAHEPLRDSFRDLANYAVIGLMLLDGTWPE